MALTKLSSSEIQTGAITTELISGDVALSLRISNVSIANSTYTVLDDTAVNVGGGYIVVTGAGFQSGAQVIINETPATSTTFVSSTELRAQVGAKSAASYDLFVVNPDGGTAIRVNGLTYSATPTWVTASALDNQAVDVAFNVAFDATGATSYANTTTLPAGTALLSNGYFYGTITGIESETTYNFTVSAIDAENQDSPREFSVTVTVGPPPGIYSWGNNRFSNLGLSDTTYRSSPIQIGSDSNWSLVSASMYNVAAIKTDGTLWSWGYGIWGGLGLNDTIGRNSPTQVGSSTNWSKVSSGNLYMVAIKTDGTLWGCGRNGYGNYGAGDTVNRSSPIQIGSDTNWELISASVNYNTAAKKTDGTIWFTGRNNRGEGGFNNITNRTTFGKIGTGTTWNKIHLYDGVFLATKNDGTLWGWGYNVVGSLGLNDINNRSSPVQIGADTNWNNISGTVNSTLITKTDDTLWTSGLNNYGQLGFNDNISRSSPVQIGTDTNWSITQVARLGHVAAIKTDGTLWNWGRNNHGQLGFNDTIHRSSPVQVGTASNWNLVTLGDYFTIAKTS
jgi:alpha-tubulin suppressor-like RCC1 family protein